MVAERPLLNLRSACPAGNVHLQVLAEFCVSNSLTPRIDIKSWAARRGTGYRSLKLESATGRESISGKAKARLAINLPASKSGFTPAC
jgi:hypothetical protein